MAISREEVLHIARLARLRLAEEEVENYRHSLNDILAYVEKLGELDTSEVEPTTHAIPLVIAPREDVVEQRLTRQDVLANAPATVDGRFQVPRVVED